MTPFDFISAINFTKDESFVEDDYVPYVINKGLSFFADTVLYANEMNLRGDIPKNQQFKFLLNTITKRKRFAKWDKNVPLSDDLKIVSDYYGFSIEKAREALRILTPEQISIIKNKNYIGGNDNDC